MNFDLPDAADLGGLVADRVDGARARESRQDEPERRDGRAAAPAQQAYLGSGVYLPGRLCLQGVRSLPCASESGILPGPRRCWPGYPGNLGPRPRSLGGLHSLLQDVGQRLGHADSFAYCLIAQNVSDTRAMTIYEDISAMGATWEAIKTGLEEFALAIDNRTWRQLLADKRLALAKFYLNEMRTRRASRWSPSWKSWRRSCRSTATTLGTGSTPRSTATLGPNSPRAARSKTCRWTAVQQAQLAQQSYPQAGLREDRGGLEVYEDLAAMELNSLVGFRLSLYKGRHWESPLTEALQMGRVERETIGRDVGRCGPRPQADSCLRGRQEADSWTGQVPLVRYDSPPGQDREDLLPTARPASSSWSTLLFLAGLGQVCGDGDRRPVGGGRGSAGKSGGGFCTGLPTAKQSRIFMTYSGNYNEMMTLAHELGHAYHSWVLKDYPHFARHYPMNLAETASTFNELVVTDAALGRRRQEGDALAVGQEARDALIMFCDIRCRYII